VADLYQLLDVDQGATPEDIKRAYRRLAREHHPDANPGDPDAEARFKDVARAYEVLSDPERRRRYDRFGDDGGAGRGAGEGGDPFAGAGIGDLFDAFFGGGSPFGGGGGGGRGDRRAGPPRGADVEVVIDLDLEDVVFGTEHEVVVKLPVPCDDCEATGAAPGSTVEVCGECGGAGQVRRVRQSMLGQMVTAAPCPRCGGMGQVVPSPCPRCRGEGRVTEERTYTVEVPAGVDTGSTLRLTGRGAVGPRGGPTGDLYAHVRVRSHGRFGRDGDHLVARLSISPSQAALGVHITYETLEGPEDLVVPPGTQSGRVFRLKGRGVPRLQSRGRGDLLVEAVVETPTELTSEEEELWRQLASLRGDEVAPASGGLLGRIRSAFS
jgi:molecular chaperone DnaJ